MAIEAFNYERQYDCVLYQETNMDLLISSILKSYDNENVL